MTHHPECEDATGEYSGSCTCAIIKRREAMKHVIYSSMPIDFERRYAMDNLIAQDADLIDPAAEWQAGYDAGIEAAAKALEDDAKKCDCFARNEGECGCGAWCEWKSITSQRAIEIVRALATPPQ